MRTDSEILNWLIDNGGFDLDPNDEFNTYRAEHNLSLQEAVRFVISDILDNESVDETDQQFNLF